MKLLARAENLLQASIWYGSLRAAGIACELRNTTLAGAMGEIPFLECAPQLWIENDGDEPRALALLEELRRPPSGPAWVCPGCGETVEPQFGSCWNCGAARLD
ncbi:MAG: DUF2007 domain-containing protein [Betaproteobacteria bacterium]